MDLNNNNMNKTFLFLIYFSVISLVVAAILYGWQLGNSVAFSQPIVHYELIPTFIGMFIGVPSFFLYVFSNAEDKFVKFCECCLWFGVIALALAFATTGWYAYETANNVPNPTNYPGPLFALAGLFIIPPAIAWGFATGSIK